MVVACLLAAWLLASSPVTAEEARPSAAAAGTVPEMPPMHCALIQDGEIQAIVGDAARRGVAGPQYCGLWSLTSVHRIFNAFGNSYAGLIPSDIRGKSPTLEVADDKTCRLTRKADEAYPVHVTATYQVKAPYYVDHDLTLRDERDLRVKGTDFREVFWCCYMNCPLDSRIHYRSGGEWHRYLTPNHGVGSRIGPSWIPQTQLEKVPADKSSFVYDWYPRAFDEPFYYGRLGNMVLILVFDQPDRVRFVVSPWGGSPSIRHDGSGANPWELDAKGVICYPEFNSPAWDFAWIIPEKEYSPGKEYRFRLRLIYKNFVSDDDVLAEVRKAQQELGFALPSTSKE
ncbi:MAG: hypothetical protein HYU36_04875 [Planctomycetes bacterium]|nr:hypothetical protein [Planctomycetota bacterium]